MPSNKHRNKLKAKKLKEKNEKSANSTKELYVNAEKVIYKFKHFINF